VVQKILSKLTADQCGVGGTLWREGAEQFVRGDKPYAWTLPVAPAIDADEDNHLNNVVSQNARKARELLQFVDGNVEENMWMPEGYDILEWYLESKSNPELTRRLALRRNTFLAQQKIIMHRCRTELSGSLLRRQKKKLTSLHKKKLEDFVSEKMESMRESARLHRAYKHRVRPNKTAAAAPVQEVKAWMISVLTNTPLRMYECKRSGKPCIYVDTEENNATCESIAACAQAGPPENTADFVTKQQFDLETNKDVIENLKFFLEEGVTVDGTTPFNIVLDELGRELSDKEKSRHRDFESDHKNGAGGDENYNIFDMQMQRREEDVTEDMRKDGWTYSSALEQYHRKKQEDRDEIYTAFQPVKSADGKYYAAEEQELIAEDNEDNEDNAEKSDSSEMELSDLDEEI
jgi:hypothetical protein